MFRTRIKRLLDLDRDMEPAGEAEKTSTPFAFSSAPPNGRGVEIPFTSFDTFCLALGLDLLDVGFKQSEVVFLMQHIRQSLSEQHDLIMRSPPTPREKLHAGDRPNVPIYDHRNFQIADCRVFILINKVELTELFGSAPDKRISPTPRILQPIFCLGIEALKDELHQMGFSYRKAMVFELSEMAVMLTDFLLEAPLVKRGRK